MMVDLSATLGPSTSGEISPLKLSHLCGTSWSFGHCIRVEQRWKREKHISAAQGSTCSFRAANSKGVACLASVITFSLSARAWRRRRTTSKCPAKAAMCKGVVPWSVPEFRTVYDFKKLEGCLFKLI